MKIYFPISLFQKMRAYTLSTDYEISGFGRTRLKDGDIYIEDIGIFKQVVNDIKTKLDRHYLADYMFELLDRGDDFGHWKLWWHTHAKAQVYFSGQDLKEIEDFDNQTHDDNWILSLVTNHKGEIQTRLDIFYPIRCSLSNIPIEFTFDDLSIPDKIYEEVNEKILFVPHKEHPQTTYPVHQPWTTTKTGYASSTPIILPKEKK